MERIGKNVLVGCMDETLHCFTSKVKRYLAYAFQKFHWSVFSNCHFQNACCFQGKKLWSIKLPGSITTMEVMDHKQKSFKAIMVALTNNEVSLSTFLAKQGSGQVLPAGNDILRKYFLWARSTSTGTSTLSTPSTLLTSWLAWSSAGMEGKTQRSSWPPKVNCGVFLCSCVFVRFVPTISVTHCEMFLTKRSLHLQAVVW